MGLETSGGYTEPKAQLQPSYKTGTTELDFRRSPGFTPLTGVLRAVFHTLSRKVHSMRVQRMEESTQMGPDSLTGFCPPFKEENTNIVQTPSESKAERILPPFPNSFNKVSMAKALQNRKITGQHPHAPDQAKTLST